MSAVLADLTVDNYMGLALAAPVLILLIIVLVFPERF
jgi:hypothetical protein